MRQSPPIHYSVQHFVEDEARVLAATDHEDVSVRECIDVLDGRLLPLPTDPLREALECKRRATDAFSSKYGPELGADHLERFRSVLDFIASHREEMAAAGLAASGETLAIREEFLDYLLNFHAGTRHGIPKTALGRFLDEWGTRWI
ncbi:MAG TPA: hypothetical protein VD788_17270 [Candidatus Polarisedimenticolaceae bacterium]|nr:hypothetical protein [Candidatus Polarisedimenticolaceae bacterium]